MRVIAILFFLGLFACDKERPNEDSFPAQCGHCGMDIEAFKDFSARAEAQKKYSFCSNRCMFVSMLIAKENNFEKVWVNDYYTHQTIDGKQAFYVVGGDIAGPMGKDLFGFQSQQAAQEYKDEHAGELILRYNEINEQIVKSILESK